MQTQTPAKPYTCDNLKVGMRFRLIQPPVQLFCNDGYQYGVWIERVYNDWTTSGGRPCSGKLDLVEPVVVCDFWDQDPQRVYVKARQRGGALADGMVIQCAISVDLLTEFFEPAEA